jgi:membrane-associated phospholipid phosphatase
MKKLILIPLLFLNLNAKTIERSGDALLILIPALTFGYSYLQDDYDGQVELVKSLAVTTLSTYALKYATKEQRPNKEDDHSFPSGHTAITMDSAVYLHKRYGLNVALPAYIGSAWTGYSRVESDNHYTHDVLAGAVLGAVSSYYFTTKYKGFEIKPIFGSSGVGLGINKSW